ncbi:MAG: polymer-forming cytoskeletal protein, partial [Chloroflexota bacterium]
MKPNRVLTLFAALVLAFSLPTSVAAADDGIFYGDTIPAGTVVEHDVVLFGKNVLIEGTVNGNVFILGNQVIVNGTVDGSLVLIAQNAAVGGDVSGTVYAAALTLDLPARSLLERDLYAATISLTSGADSAIGRHLYALGLDAGLNGQIGGDLHTALGPIQLYNGLMRLLGFDELTLELHFEVPAADTVPQGFVPLRHLRIKFLEPLPPFDWGQWGLGLLHSW